MNKIMSRLWIAGLTAMLALAGGLSQASESGAANAADWEQQIRQPLYLLYLTSNINVINGLDLTQEQAMRLRALAREVERISPPTVILDHRQAGPFATVVATNLELRDVLLRGETPSQELKTKVIGARLNEAGLLRRSLLAEGQGKPAETCTQCHARPDENFGTGPGTTARDSLRFDTREQMRAHMDLLIGKKAIGAIWMRMNQTDAVLADFQKAAFEDFSCCLLPPDLSGGALKIGQAANPSKMMALLEEARAADETQWPAVKTKLVAGLTARDRALHPRRSPQQEQQATKRLAATLQSARELKEVDFMIHKNKLCSALEPARVKTSNPAVLRFKTAFFLLLPGSVRAYDAYLDRLAKKGSKSL